VCSSDLKSKKPKKDRALKSIDKAVTLYNEQRQWRTKAATALLPGLNSYETVARETLGIRAQSKLTRDQGLYMASCMSGHRDISLNF